MVNMNHGQLALEVWQKTQDMVSRISRDIEIDGENLSISTIVAAAEFVLPQLSEWSKQSRPITDSHIQE